MKLNLSKLPWFNRDNIWVTGFIFSGDKFLRDNELLDYFSGINTLTDFEERLKSANGKFSIIISHENETWAATDRTRNIPLFYTKIDKEFILSDDSYKLAELKKENEFDTASFFSFLAAGYTINNRTLLKDIFQVEAGAIVVLGDEIKTIYYDNPSIYRTIEKHLETASVELSELLEDTFRRYFIALKDRFIAIPLSGGYDSRLVALMASKYHPDDVLCYTYGRVDNPEVKLAEEVAKRLNLKWINIIYNEDLVRDFVHDGFFESYYPWVSGLSGMFFLQEYFAVRYLKQNKIIPDNTVFISGYSGDFIAGSYLTPHMKNSMNKKDLTELIFREYFRLTGLNKQNRSSVCEIIAEKIPDGLSDAWKVVESWDLKERHAKFIVNSSKVFNYFGYEYIFPLWDNRLVDFMLPLAFDLRMNRRLYEHTVRDHIFKENNLNLGLETNPTPLRKTRQRLKERIKPLIPRKIRDIFIEEKNQILYDEITRILRDDIDPRMIIPPAQPNYYNSYIIQWYLIKTAERLGIRMLQ